MNTIRHTNTLFYHDGPQVIEARDDAGQDYIGLLLMPDGADERYILKPVSRDRLVSFQSGAVDLRSMFLDDSRDECFLAAPGGRFDEPLLFEARDRPMDELDWMPAPGFFLSEQKARKENPSGLETEGVPAGKPWEISPPPLRGRLGKALEIPVDVNLTIRIAHAQDHLRAEFRERHRG